jgi:hypothetical protein
MSYIRLIKETLEEELTKQNKITYEHYIHKIVDKWGSQTKITYDYLIEKYPISKLNIRFLKKIKPIPPEMIAKQRYLESKKNSLIDVENRCQARTWKDTPPLVYFDEIENTWIYGEQCMHVIFKNNLCQTHNKHNPHGLYINEPPHTKFEKYKLKKT